MKSPIKHSAIKVGNIVYVGHRHHDCFLVMHNCGVSKIGNIQGFVDEDGVFWDRIEALAIATYFNQISEKHNPQDKLMSEDLY